MKKTFLALAAAFTSLSLITAVAQTPGLGGASSQLFGDGVATLFGGNTNFSADLEIQGTGGPTGGTMVLTGKTEYSGGKCRFEIDMGQIKGIGLPPQAIEQMKQMGMDKMDNISRPDKQVMYMIYPNAKAYMQIALPATAGNPADFKVAYTKLGEEKVDGHNCLKSKVVATDKLGKTHEYTVWQAGDLNKFPVRVEMPGQGANAVLVFKNVKLAPPAAADFEPPVGMKKCSSPVEIMQSRAAAAH